MYAQQVKIKCGCLKKVIVIDYDRSQDGRRFKESKIFCDECML
jgi:hypothetical protein